MNPLVGLIMGSTSDWGTLEHAANTLDALGVPHEVRVVSAHRTPDLLFEYAASAEARGLEVIIAGAGGAAHLPGMVAAKTVLPVLGVPGWWAQNLNFSFYDDPQVFRPPRPHITNLQPGVALLDSEPAIPI